MYKAHNTIVQRLAVGSQTPFAERKRSNANELASRQSAATYG